MPPSPHSGHSKPFTQQVDPDQHVKPPPAAGRAESRSGLNRVNGRCAYSAPRMPCFPWLYSVRVFGHRAWQHEFTQRDPEGRTGSDLAHLVQQIGRPAFSTGANFDLEGRPGPVGRMNYLFGDRHPPRSCRSPTARGGRRDKNTDWARRMASHPRNLQQDGCRPYKRARAGTRVLQSPTVTCRLKSPLYMPPTCPGTDTWDSSAKKTMALSGNEFRTGWAVFPPRGTDPS